MKKIIVLLSILSILIISCQAGTRGALSPKIEDESNANNGSNISNVNNGNSQNNQNNGRDINNSFKNFKLHNVDGTPEVLVNTKNYWEKNADLEKYYSTQVRGKYIGSIDKTKRYYFDNNLDLYNADKTILYKKYIKAVLVKMHDYNNHLNGQYVVGAAYQVENPSDYSTVGSYEIIVYNNGKSFSIDSKDHYVISLFRLYDDANENYNPDKVFGEVYDSINSGDYENWIIFN